VTDQKFSRDLGHGRTIFLRQFSSLTINVAGAVSTISGGNEEQYCSILAQVLRCSAVTLDLFRNNMKKQSIHPPNVDPAPRPPPPPVYIPPRNVNSQPYHRPPISAAPSPDPPVPDFPADSLPYPSTAARQTSLTAFRIEPRKSGERLLITKGSQKLVFTLSKSDESSGTSEASSLPAPPSLGMPPDLGFEPSKIDSDFSVVPLQAAPVPHVKVKFSVPPSADVSPSVFHPEPLFDAAWRYPTPSIGRVPKEMPVRNVPVMTRLNIINAKTPTQKAQIAELYPFL
jgi:hypothetical protein